MSDTPSDDFIAQMNALWAEPQSVALHLSPAYKALRGITEREYGCGKTFGAEIALSNALRSLGLPMLASSTATATATTDAEAATFALHQAFRATTVQRLHLVPLHLADALPEQAFGPARIASFSRQEIEEVFQLEKLQRWYGKGYSLDTNRLRQLQWLVVTEDLPCIDEPGKRVMPLLYQPVSSWGDRSIHPHASRFPQAVIDALFVMLLAPWEDWTDRSMDWRAFETPWVHTVESDLFARPFQLPDIETLAWVPQYDDYGEEVGERPVTIALAGEPSPYLTQDRWDEIERARKAPIFNKTIPHFLTSAFLSSDMDELISHIITLEAALGLQDDFKTSPPSPASRLRARIVALLGLNSGKLHQRLVKLRNKYVHGTPLSAIDGRELTEARRLARRVVTAVIGRATAQPETSRRASLNQLLNERPAPPSGFNARQTDPP